MLTPLTKHIFLITRPSHQAKNLITQIENLKGQSLLFPTLTIVPRSFEQIAKAILNLNTKKIDKIIFTSANAVYPVMPHWEKIKSAPTVFAIGSGTAKALASFQISVKIPATGQFNSEGLLNLPELQMVQNQQIIVFSGMGGRHFLIEQLKKRGACVKKIVVYHRTCPMMMGVFPPAENISLIISTSAESLKNLWQMVGSQGQIWLCEQQLLVISDHMAALALKLGFKHKPLVASNASDEAILSVITTWCGKSASGKHPTNQTI